MNSEPTRVVVCKTELNHSTKNDSHPNTESEHEKKKLAVLALKKLEEEVSSVSSEELRRRI